jgi:predicted alpha/beta-hydrolase family hydrolase
LPLRPAPSFTGPDGLALLLAHGAGAAMDSRWMDDMAASLGGHGIRVVRFPLRAA